MHINGSWAKFAATRIGQRTTSIPPQQCPQKNNRRPHFLHQGFGNLHAVHTVRLNAGNMPFHGTATAQCRQNPARRKNIRQTGTIFQHSFSTAEQRSCKNGQHTIFCPLQRHCSLQRNAACNHQFLHPHHLKFFFSHGMRMPIIWCESVLIRILVRSLVLLSELPLNRFL